MLLSAKLKRRLRAAFSSPYYWSAYSWLGGKAFAPLKVDWELTFRCNLCCRMCPQELFKSQSGRRGGENRQKELSLAELRAVADDLAGMGVKLITLTGGEPFLHPDAAALAVYIKQKGMACNILTNGGALTGETALQIAQAKVDAVTFSLDGPPAVHDAIRGRKGCFNRLRRAVQMLQEAKMKVGGCFPSLAFNCTISALNQDCFSRVLETARQLQVPSVNFGYLFFTTTEAVQRTRELVHLQGVKEENQVLPDELRKVDTGSIERQIAAAERQALKYGINVDFLPPLSGKEIDSYFHDPTYSYCSKCFVPWYAGRINPYGAVYPCSVDYCVGNVRQEKFSSLWNARAYRCFRRKLKKRRLFPKCRKCCELNDKLWDKLPPWI